MGITVQKIDSNDKEEEYKSLRISLTLYYTLIVFMSNLIMFILMTYNFGIILSVILGNVVGYGLFFNQCNNVNIHKNVELKV